MYFILVMANHQLDRFRIFLRDKTLPCLEELLSLWLHCLRGLMAIRLIEVKRPTPKCGHDFSKNWVLAYIKRRKLDEHIHYSLLPDYGCDVISLL